VIELLLAAGADVNATNELKETPLMLTKLYGKRGTKARQILQQHLEEATVREYRVNTLVDKILEGCPSGDD
jgi:hypothetical protein